MGNGKLLDEIEKASVVMCERLTELHALAQALDDAEGLGDILDEALGLAEAEARVAIEVYVKALKALREKP